MEWEGFQGDFLMDEGRTYSLQCFPLTNRNPLERKFTEDLDRQDCITEFENSVDTDENILRFDIPKIPR